MGVKALTRWGFLAAALLLVFEVRATSIRIDIDTDALGLNTQNWDLAWDLNDGNPQPNSVQISNFSIVGGGLTGAANYPVTTGNVTGNLSVAPGIVTLDDSVPVPQFFNEYLDNADIGTLLSFMLELTDNFESGFDPDTLSFFILDPMTGLPIPTGDLSGALFVYSIGNDNQPTTFCLTTAPCVVVTPVVVAVPEPGTMALAISALLALALARTAARGSASARALTA